jgi:hypothetical protein
MINPTGGSFPAKNQHLSKAPFKKVFIANATYGRYKEQTQKIYKAKYLVIKDEKIFGECNSCQEAFLKGWHYLAKMPIWFRIVPDRA